MKHVTTKMERDKRVIEALVRGFGPLSRVDIHRLTDLRRNTISLLVRELLDEGKLLEAGRSNNPMGRKQIMLRLNEDHRYIVGVEFDNEFVAASAMNLHPTVKSAVREPTYLAGGLEGLVKQLVACTRKSLRQAGLKARCLLGIGVADPGLVDTREGITVTSSTIEFWRQVPLKKIFEDEFKIPTLLETRARAQTVAERLLGAGEMADDMIYVEYGAGIGVGIILEGKLVRGHRFAAGEFGHTHIIDDGPACKCGSFGCLEAIAGASALEARIRRAVREGSMSRALALSDGNPDRITGWMVLAAAREGDKASSALVEQIGNYLGIGIANLVNLLNPSVVVLDQRLESAGAALLEQIVRVVKRESLSFSTEDLVFKFAKLGTQAGVLGVGLMVLERHFEIPLLKLPKFMIESP